jgi:hypothetical protein
MPSTVNAVGPFSSINSRAARNIARRALSLRGRPLLRAAGSGGKLSLTFVGIYGTIRNVFIFQQSTWGTAPWKPSIQLRSLVVH